MLATVAITAAWGGALVTAYLAAVFLVAAPDRALAQATHRAELLPRVMGNRYATFSILSLASAIAGNPLIIAVSFATLAFPAVCDTILYARAGHPYSKHLVAAVAALAVSALALAAARSGGF